jgi:serine/threonine-protein kinase
MDQEGQKRFRREGTLLARLSHPHIAQLLDAGVTPSGQPYLVLEYVEGTRIDRYADERRLSLDDRLALFLQVADVVAHAHASLVVHRDLKPSNVLVNTSGQVKLLDFGIATLLEEGTASENVVRTLTDFRVLTPAYAAPEQVTGEPVTTATDVYALGVLLYELLVGRHPTVRGTPTAAEVLRAITEQDPSRLSDAAAGLDLREPGDRRVLDERQTTWERLRRECRGDLDTILGKALKKSPLERYASATAFADDLRRYLAQEPIRARPDAFGYRAAKFVRRNRLAVALASAALIAAASGTITTFIQARAARAERDFALRQLSRAEAINELNTFVLSDAAPLGKPFTVTDLLARAEHIVARQRGAPSDRVDLLVAIGRQYWILDEIDKSQRVLEEAYQLSRGLNDRSTRARASCTLGSALSHVSVARAEALTREGLDELPPTSQYAVDRALCLLRGSEVARMAGASADAIARAQSAHRELQQAPVRSEQLELTALIDLAESYREAGRTRDAVTAFEQASELLKILGRDDTQQAGTLFNNWGLAVSQLGQPIAAEPLFRRAIEVSRADATDDAVSPTLLSNYAFELMNLARSEEAVEYADRAHSRASALGDEQSVFFALFARIAICLDLGRIDCAEAALAELEPRLRRVFPADHPWFASVAFRRAGIARARGEHGAALDMLNEVMALTEAQIKAGRGNSSLIPIFLIERSELELELKHPSRAVADAREAVKLIQGELPPDLFSSDVGQANLALGRALAAEGKDGEARAAMELAAEHLGRTLGPDHPDTRSARNLAESPDR